MKSSAFLSFLLLSIFNGLLIFIRLVKTRALSEINISDFSNLHSHRWMYLFLVWNLFLAWIPFLLSIIAKNNYFAKTRYFFNFLWFTIWLLFFPNALYIITDFIHLRPRSGIPYWFDIMILFSFSITALLLGLQSLKNIIDIITQKYKSPKLSYAPYFLLFLGSIGVYLGRFQRWNSWDIINRPLLIFKDIISLFLQPQHHFNQLGIIFSLTLFFSLLYQLLYTNGTNIKNTGW